MTSKSPQPTSRLRKLWKDWFKPLLVCLLIIAPFRSAVADWNDVPTGSMQPTIQIGDRIFVNKLAYDLKVPFTTAHIIEWSGPVRGDVVVCYSPADGKRLVKRVVGVPGDAIALRGNVLVVNGQPCLYTQIPAPGQKDVTLLTERFGPTDPGHTIRLLPRRLASRNFDPVVVPSDHYLMMGDNRDNSFDSRGFGFVPRSEVLGQATGVVFSFDGASARWERFFSALE